MKRPSKLRSAFNGCQNKEDTNFKYLRQTSTISLDEVHDRKYASHVVAITSCPVTRAREHEPHRLVRSSAERSEAAALRQLATEMGRSLCYYCIHARMTPAEVQVFLRNAAEAPQEAAFQQQLLEEARQEVAAIDPLQP